MHPDDSNIPGMTYSTASEPIQKKSNQLIQALAVVVILTGIIFFPWFFNKVIPTKLFVFASKNNQPSQVRLVSTNISFAGKSSDPNGVIFNIPDGMGETVTGEQDISVLEQVKEHKIIANDNSFERGKLIVEVFSGITKQDSAEKRVIDTTVGPVNLSDESVTINSFETKPCKIPTDADVACSVSYNKNDEVLLLVVAQKFGFENNENMNYKFMKEVIATSKVVKVD